jgi:hypothetical protein
MASRQAPTPNGPFDPPLPPNDPGPDSLFEKVDEKTNRCLICGALVFNSTEARDAHLNTAELGDDQSITAAHAAQSGSPA